MRYIDNFLEYLYVIRKHSENTIINYRVDLCEFLEFTQGRVSIDKDTVNKYLKLLIRLYILVNLENTLP